MKKILFTTLALVLAVGLSLPMASPLAAAPYAEYDSHDGTIYVPTTAGSAAQIAPAVSTPYDGSFVQMGPESWVVLKFPGSYVAVPDGASNADIRVDTWDALFRADAEVSVSLDGSAWTSLGVYEDTATIDIDLDGIGPVRYVKVDQADHYIDQAYPLLGFDLNGVDALNSGVAFPLCAGKHIEVGNVVVWDDGTDLYVKYMITEAGWTIVETHLDVVADADDFPTTEKGNPKVGHFGKKMTHIPGVTEYVYTYNLNDEEWTGESLFVAAHAVVVKLVGEGCQAPQWASDWVEYQQGLQIDGSSVTDPNRIDPDDALGIPDVASGPWRNFFSLGLEGYITVTFGPEGDDSYPIYNGPGAYDISVHEVSGNRGTPTEDADVYVIVDDTAYFAGSVKSSDNGTGVGYVSIPDEFAYVDAVKVVDDTNAEDHRALGFNGDGYDVDAVDACFLVEQEETAWGDGCDGQRFVQKGNWATYFTYTVQGEIVP